MREWFSEWPKIEVISPPDNLAEFTIPSEAPIVAIAAKEDFFSAEIYHLTVNMVRGGWDDVCEDIFKAKEDTRMFWRKDGGKCLIGKPTDKNRKDISAKRDLVSRLIAQVKDDKCDKILLVLGRSVASDFFEVIDAGLFQLYRYDCFLQPKPEDKHPSLLSVIVFDAARFAAAAEKINHIMHSVFFAADLINRPPSDKKPLEIAGKISASMGESGLPVSLSFVNEPMGLVRAVCRGSNEQPILLRGEYCPADKKNEKPIVLVGKGVCFDSGGINLKTDSKNMKFDMSGAAVVFGILRAVALQKMPVHLVVLAPFVYNMPGGNAYKPDDVVAAYNGKTVEIQHTDAEGRLILADVLAYAAEQFKPELIVDYATLTGACVVALGEDIAGIFSVTGCEGGDWRLTRLFIKAGQETGEPHWPLPLYEPYWATMTSKIADMSNLSSSHCDCGGAITAALFLKQFVGDVPWKHIDIAGPAEKTAGFGVRSGIRFLEKYLDLENK